MTKFGKLILFGIIVVVLIIVGFFLQKKSFAPISPVINNFVPNTAEREILGNKDDLVSFSILPNSKVHGVLSYRGTIKGGYFFEGNILINVLDANKNVLKQSNAMATTDWNRSRKTLRSIWTSPPRRSKKSWMHPAWRCAQSAAAASIWTQPKFPRPSRTTSRGAATFPLSAALT